MNTSFDDFTQMLGDDKRVQGLDAGNIKLTYNSVSVVFPCHNIYQENKYLPSIIFYDNCLVDLNVKISIIMHSYWNC